MRPRTERLVALFPDVYAAGDPESLLHKLLDAAGAELAELDEALKRLLKSHWVDYAEGQALDGLASIFGVERRRLPGGVREPDSLFRPRVRSVVQLFTGGGTRRAVLGGVRSALGLPFDVGQLNLPDAYAGLRADLEALIRLEEFSPRGERLTAEIADGSAAGELIIEVPLTSVVAAPPRFEWTFTHGAGRRLRLERMGTDEGIRADPALVVPEGETLLLHTGADGRFNAFVGGVDVSAYFSGPAGGAPRIPMVPTEPSAWRFTAAGALFDTSVFDRHDRFDLPRFLVRMAWQSREPLTFDVVIPYFLGKAVQALRERHGYPGEIFVYEGLDLEAIQEVVDRTRAAGVRGRVHFVLDFRADHGALERFSAEARHSAEEDADAGEAFAVASGAALDETHEVEARLAIGGIYDVSRFDLGFGFH